jgi:trans-aconitate 2-methyltransferase
MSWNPAQYLKFVSERTRACHDLANRISVSNVRRVIDLGCGPGNSTEVLAGRWPEAEIIGLDNSNEMIKTARQSQPNREWLLQEIDGWAAGATEPFDVVFSNAALHWVSNHDVVLPRLLTHTAPAGALAIQMPYGFNAPQHQLMREVAASAGWRRHFPPDRVHEWHVHDIAFYYDLLAPRASGVDFWVTQYLHVMANAEAIVDWYKGTGLRPFLDVLESDADKARFTDEYLAGIRKCYPPQPDGRVLLPFPRIFLIAYR